MRIVLVCLILLGCSSSNDNMTLIKGVSETQFPDIAKKLIGKQPDTVRKILGNPIIEGESGSTYKMIYPTKDMKKFYVEITYNTDVELDCTVIEFVKPKKRKKFVFPRYGKLRKFLRCNQKEGAILKLMN